MNAPTPSEFRLRRPLESDYPRVAAVVNEWWDGDVVRGLLPHLWFRHFTTTSWLAELAGENDRAELAGANDSATLAGFLVGFVSPSLPTMSVIQAVGVNPNHRRVGIGRALVTAFFTDAALAGTTSVEALAWPANRRALPFLQAMGFELARDADTLAIYGVPAFQGYDFGTEDRARFTRAL